LLITGSLEFVKDIEVCSKVLRFLCIEVRIDIAAAHADLLDQPFGTVPFAIEAGEYLESVTAHYFVMALVAIVLVEYFLPVLRIAIGKRIGGCGCNGAQQKSYREYQSCD
jgi:hypothetical protein